ncbi:MAG: carboxypeptidase regulatory-like domain-containing protein [Bryobacteraceae bacterium]
MHNSSSLKRTLIALLGVAMLLPGQTTSTSILGKVTDPSGAAVVGADVTIDSITRGLTRHVNTNEAGFFTAPGLDPGEYNVSVEQSGFKRNVRSNVDLRINQKLTLDFTLEIGAASETVTVAGQTPVVDSASATLGTVVSQRQIVDLPLNGRNYAQLAYLIPGVTPGQRHSNDSVNFSNPYQIAANGQRQFNTELTLDGVSVNSALLNQSNFRPSIDALEEFRVQTGNYSAEYGMQSGAQVNLVLKAGTNAFHGAVFEFLRNDKLDARDFFQPSTQAKSPFKQNQFGGVVGGPILKNKTFFFTSYEGYIRRKARVGSAVTLTDAQRQGILGGTTPIKDPDNPTTFFPNNVIPPSRLSPEAQKVLQFMPRANTAGTLNFSGATINRADQQQGFQRVDHQFRPEDKIFIRYGISDQHIPEIQLNPNFAETQDIRDQNLTANYIHLFNSSTLNEFRIAYNRANDEFFGPDRSNFSPLKDLGISGVAEDPKLKGVPDMSIPGILGIGEHFLVPLTQLDWTYSVAENISKTIGSHTFKAGLDFRKQRLDRFFQQSNRGSFSFTGAVSGNAIADFLLGLPASTTRAVGNGIYNNIHQIRQGYYVQDDWRVSRQLTLNIGLRYEIMGVPEDSGGNLRTFDFKTQKLVPEFGVTQGLYEPDHHNFAPRFGFAWSPIRLRGKQLVVRGGYGIYYNMPQMQVYTLMGNNPPASLTESFNVADGKRLTLANGFPGSGNLPAFPALLPIAGDYKPAYVQSWTLGIQQEIIQNTVVEVAYVGSKSTRLDQTETLNMPTPGPGPSQLRRPNPNIGAIRFFSSDANSTYHGLQTRVERRMQHGLTLLAAYTFSKTIDDNFTSTSTPLNTARWAQDPLNRKAEKSQSSFNIPQRLSFTYLWQPFTGKQLWGSSALGFVASNWQLSGTTTMQSGLPFTVLVPGDPANLGTFGSNIRANRVGPSRPEGFHQDPYLWLSTAAFRDPDKATDAKCIAAPSSCTYYGNLGRLTESGPGVNNWDIGVARRFAISERQALEFRFEMFNAFNRTHFDMPGNVTGSATFLRITSTNPQIPNRDLQFALKYVF